MAGVELNVVLDCDEEIHCFPNTTPVRLVEEAKTYVEAFPGRTRLFQKHLHCSPSVSSSSSPTPPPEQHMWRCYNALPLGVRLSIGNPSSIGGKLAVGQKKTRTAAGSQHRVSSMVTGSLSSLRSFLSTSITNHLTLAVPGGALVQSLREPGDVGASPKRPPRRRRRRVSFSPPPGEDDAGEGPDTDDAGEGPYTETHIIFDVVECAGKSSSSSTPPPSFDISC